MKTYIRCGNFEGFSERSSIIWREAIVALTFFILAPKKNVMKKTHLHFLWVENTYKLGLGINPTNVLLKCRSVSQNFKLHKLHLLCFSNSSHTKVASLKYRRARFVKYNISLVTIVRHMHSITCLGIHTECAWQLSGQT